MKFIVLDTPAFNIDGGAYFGVVPKIIWEKKYPANEHNMCKAACRSLLFDDGEHIILVDTGIGDKPEDDKPDLYFTDYSHNLLQNIKNAGYSCNDITDVILTHLHFDHCGGTTRFCKENGKFVLNFPNAKHYVSKQQWESAFNPNYREKSSFDTKKISILEQEGNLILVDKHQSIGKYTELLFFNGHTDGLMLPLFNAEGFSLFFAGDLIPAIASVPLAWISAYDIRPLVSIEEKQKLLKLAADNKWIMFFQHDYYNQCCRIVATDRGYRATDSFNLVDFLNE